MSERPRILSTIKRLIPEGDEKILTVSYAISGGTAGGILLGPIGIGPGIAVGVATERTISLSARKTRKKEL